MGTNYYHRTNICDCCGRYDEQHICKSLTSFEWVEEWIDGTGYVPVVTMWAGWRARLGSAGGVWDEYGKEIPVEEFIAKVEATSPEARRRQYEWVARNLPQEIAREGERGKTWLDPDGFSFYGGAFS